MKIFIYLMVMFCVSCEMSKSTPQVTSARAQSEINAAILKVLEKYAPHILSMPKGLEQAKEVMNTLHNVTRIYNDPRQETLGPEELLETVFTDPTMGLICGGFSLVIFDSLKALGYETRMVQLFSAGFDSHIANGVKVDGKWYALDGTFNIIFKDPIDGNTLSYREMTIQARDYGKGIDAEYVGNTHLRLEDYYLPYEQYLVTVRALPPGLRYQANKDVILEREERF